MIIVLPPLALPLFGHSLTVLHNIYCRVHRIHPIIELLRVINFRQLQLLSLLIIIIIRPSAHCESSAPRQPFRAAAH